MAFLNSFIFPTKISRGSQGGPRWATEVVVTDGGYEYRNQPWAYPLHDYDVAYGVKTIVDLETLLAAFHSARAMTDAFRYLDPLDSKSCARDSTPAYTDQTIISSATGGETTAQLIKTYSYGGVTLDRKITRPYGTVYLGINSVEKTEDTHFTVDKTTGVIDFTGGSSPNGALTASDVVTAGFTFHVPVRFNTNTMPITLQEYTYGNASVPLTEIRE